MGRRKDQNIYKLFKGKTMLCKGTFHEIVEQSFYSYTYLRKLVNGNYDKELKGKWCKQERVSMKCVKRVG